MMKIHPKLKSIAVTGGKVLGGGLIGYAGAKILPPLFWWGVHFMNPRIQIPLRKFTPRHKVIGESMILAGALTGNPVLSGVGGGMVVADNDDSVLRKQEWTKKKAEAPHAFNIVRYNIPSWLPMKVQYNMLGTILTEIVTKPTWNAQKKEWIPPGREHPDVIAKAREIFSAGCLDGHDKLATVRAVQQWVQNNIKYTYDPRWMDVFAHPYLTLKTKTEDCDGQALLTASLLEALGIPMVLMLIGQNNPDTYNHILSAAVIERKLVPVETIPIPAPGAVNNAQRITASFGYMPSHIHKLVIPLP